MNQTFDLSRWWMLVERHWAENRKRYGLALLAMAGLLTAWYTFLMIMDDYAPLNIVLQFTAYYCGLYLVGCFYASTLLAELSDKAQGTNYLTLPASQLEKLLCALFFGVFLFFIAYNLVYYIVDIPMVHLANRIIAEKHQVWPGTNSQIGSVEVLNVFTESGPPFWDGQYHVFMTVYFSVQSAFILGSVWFRRYSFLKSIVAVLLCFLGGIFVLNKAIETHLPAGWRLDNLFEWVQYPPGEETGVVRLSGWIETALMILVRFSPPFILWVITWYRLKEKEI
jgi:hypothetical protein